MFNLFKKKKQRKGRIADDAIVLEVKINGYDEFVEQVKVMSLLVDELSAKHERFGIITEPVSVVHNHYNLCVSAVEAEKCQP